MRNKLLEFKNLLQQCKSLAFNVYEGEKGGSWYQEVSGELNNLLQKKRGLSSMELELNLDRLIMTIKAKLKNLQELEQAKKTMTKIS